MALSVAPEWEALGATAEAAKAVGADVISVVSGADVALINATGEQREQIEKSVDVTLYPNFEYELAAYPAAHIDISAASASNAALTGPHEYSFLVEGPSGKPVARVKVQVWLKGRSEPAVGITDEAGAVTFSLCEPEAVCVDVFPRAHFWCARLDRPKASANARKVYLEEIFLPYKDSLVHFFPSMEGKPGKGVTIAIIDTGVAEHKDLPVPRVKKTILKGVVTDGADDNGTDHGTHVAGIIAGQGGGIKGTAPGASLMVYRVFADGLSKCGSLDIATAIDLAVNDGADIINLSLGYPGYDDSIKMSIENAVDSGVFVVAATGNDGKNGLRFPARLDSVFAVGAVGLSKAFAPTSTHRSIGVHQANNDNEFVAAFSNYSVDGVDGAGPGVAVISTGHADGYLTMSGTSMAAPAVAGVAASLLSQNPEVAALSGAERVKALRELLYNQARTLQFDNKYVGSGVPAL